MTLVWHRADLRVPENPAIAAGGTDAVPAFVAEPPVPTSTTSTTRPPGTAASATRASLSRRHETVEDDPDESG